MEAAAAGRGHPAPAAAGRRPRVLLLATLAEVGGVATYLSELLPALTERFDVVVAAHGPGPLRAATEAAGARYVPLRDVRRPLHPWRDLLGLVELLRLCRRERPDVVHANSSKAGALGRLAGFAAGVPVRVFSVHGWGFAQQRPRWLFLWVDRLLAPLTTLTICVSEAVLREGVAARTCCADRSVVVRNAVAAGGRPRAEPGTSPPTVVSVGRLKWPKDFATLVRALAFLDQSVPRTVVVGDGPERRALEEEARRLGLVSLEFAGEQGDVAKLLAQAAVFVLPSRSEGFPMSVLEAMAAGLPVVASSVGGVAEAVVDGETGLLVPPGDPEALAAALRRLLADPELRRRLGAAGRRRVEACFDIGRFRSAHVELYTRVLEAGGRLVAAG